MTGKPAQYRDPKTGLPYADLEAFKILRSPDFVPPQQQEIVPVMVEADVLPTVVSMSE